MTKLKYCYSHLKSFVFMFWIVVHVFKSFQHPYTPNPLFPSNFLLSYPNTFPNLFQILHCFIHHKSRQFHPSLSPFFFFLFLLRTLPTSLHLECCATPFMLPFHKEMHIATHPFSTHLTFSILSFLPQCDSAINVLSVHLSLITLLLNQLSERNHTTVLRFHSYF